MSRDSLGIFFLCVLLHQNSNAGHVAEHGSGHEMKYAYLYHRASARGHLYSNNNYV